LCWHKRILLYHSAYQRYFARHWCKPSWPLEEPDRIKCDSPKMRKIALGHPRTERWPTFGCTASGGASALEPAARHRCRTRVSTDFSQLFPHHFPFLLGSDVSHQKSEIRQSSDKLFDLRFLVETSDLKKRGNFFFRSQERVPKKRGKGGKGAG